MLTATHRVEPRCCTASFIVMQLQQSLHLVQQYITVQRTIQQNKITREKLERLQLMTVNINQFQEGSILTINTIACNQIDQKAVCCAKAAISIKNLHIQLVLFIVFLQLRPTVRRYAHVLITSNIIRRTRRDCISFSCSFFKMLANNRRQRELVTAREMAGSYRFNGLGKSL